MNHDAYPDSYIREILNGVKSIAMVGASPVNVRPSYFAFKYLAQRGYDMIPVNPGHVGKSLLGKPFVASLAISAVRRHDRHLPQFEPHHACGR
jgi:predicted CoA-binding protein